MTTAINPGCTCGAAEASIKFEMQVDHQVHCYISLAKEAEAVQGVPVQQVGSNPVNPPAPADELYAPEPVNQTITLPSANVPAQPPIGGRRALVDPGPETEFCKIRFVPGLPTPLIEAYGSEGKPSIVQCGRISGKLLNVREVDTNYGVGTAIDLELNDPNNELNRLVVGCFASSMLARLIKMVHVGTYIEIVRVPSAEKYHVYEVYVLD